MMCDILDTSRGYPTNEEKIFTTFCKKKKSNAMHASLSFSLQPRACGGKFLARLQGWGGESWFTAADLSGKTQWLPDSAYSVPPY